MRVLYLIFTLFLFSPKLSACTPLIQALVKSIRDPRFSVVVDLDGTILDTDRVWVNQIIPKAVDEILPEVESRYRSLFLQFKERLKLNGYDSFPTTYSREAWLKPPFSFPIKALPASMPLTEFWALTVQIFEREIQKGLVIPHLPTFQIFYEYLQPYWGDRAEWIILTARTKAQVEGVVAPIPVSRFIWRTKMGHTSVAHGYWKAGEMERMENPVRVYLDNDPTILEIMRQWFPSTHILKMHRNSLEFYPPKRQK